MQVKKTRSQSKARDNRRTLDLFNALVVNTHGKVTRLAGGTGILKLKAFTEKTMIVANVFRIAKSID